MQEKTVVLVKPDGVKRGLIGDVVSRIEKRGLKIIAMKMVLPTEQRAKDHYPKADDWFTMVGEKTKEDLEKHGKDVKAELGTDDPTEIGKLVGKWNTDFLTSGPVVAMVVQGIYAIDMMRKIVGHTLPFKAEMGTIRGDYSVDSPLLAALQKRTVRNVVHASGDASEAKHEVQLWFDASEINEYTRAEEDTMF
ncbi:nucleoside-diphosphate kinase [Candidatus Uhrbacteria bacterium CG10_big_fil_rev_8_21_14_0_10_48_11]|uniref:nucleoside-diphosphate kinase n=1 Tax=Candidatus Uhrbacteria bacterium CG10_big_fil_rev_8_21_14_0_10_48_11 TaxID=1975037 RepID=A0A2M8LF26_9BACT|nr:MAG: nucleoside-diphosphate kinase [Candidatus Uhrbacteria bacterium CG10_big_fil_rev_8_21_14_0_10_48_11]